MNSIVYELPPAIKIRLGRIQTYFNQKKRKVISSVDACFSNDFPQINTIEFKNSLKKFFRDVSWNEKEVNQFKQYLYNDVLTKVNSPILDESKPYIISVVKNEASKLDAFFRHYNNLGSFNYVFIDNGSSDNTVDIILTHGGLVYKCLEPFTTQRKLAWINKVYSTFPQNAWTLLLDADELLVYEGYERDRFESIIKRLDSEHIDLCGAVMIDMFSNKPCMSKDYIKEYIYFENNFHEEKSVFCNSVYGGIREREFKQEEYEFSSGRVFLVKKHPVIKKLDGTLLIHCHYIYPFFRNYKSEIYFGLLHYKLFDNEIEKYKRIASEGTYGNGSVEYKSYMNRFLEKTYEEIFSLDENSVEFKGTKSLQKIKCIKKIPYSE